MISLPHRHATYLTTLIGLLCFMLIVLDRTGIVPQLRGLVLMLYEWLLLLASFAMLIGIAHVLLTHLRRILQGQMDWTYSLILVTACSAVLVAGLLQPSGVTSPTIEWIFDTLLAPGQATLYALLFFFLAAAAYQWLRLTQPAGRWMLAGALVVLITQMPASHALLPAAWSAWVGWLLQGPVMATVRGALLGSVLALLFFGMRFLLGRSRS
ncbi:MAG: hypothetical protein KF832_15230 [Caldilineaceae bacterium]|nr:hypothetical protein [Caldilineaceae bacterium]